MGISKNEGSPKWLVCSGKSQSKMDDNSGYPYLWKPPWIIMDSS